MGCVTESVKKNGSTLIFTGRGWGRQIVDVYGVRGTTGSHSRNLEGVAVEVKPSRSKTSLRNLFQASQYARLAHRCYLAQPREFDARTVAEATTLGLGLLRITERKIILVTPSKRFEPDREAFEIFLSKLRIVRCAVCDCHILRYKKRNPHINAKGHWVVDQFSPLASGQGANKKMYLCPKCERIISGVAQVGSLRGSIRKLEKRMNSVERSKRK